MTRRPVYPFAAIVGQEELKLGLVLTVISPTMSGILVRGEKGTAKSTAVRALVDLLPEQAEIEDNPYHLSADEAREYPDLVNGDATGSLPLVRRRVRLVELPVGATEDRVVGTLDLEAALGQGRKRFEPGLLASAHRGILYVDEVNLLDDHVVDLLLDSAAMGVNTVEREGVSVVHPARFSLVGSMNPEEGELRPQLLDRFGLCVQVDGVHTTEDRVEIVKRRLAFDEDPEGFCAAWREEQAQLASRIVRAAQLLARVRIDDATLLSVATTCAQAQVDGHRADIMMVRAGAALAAWRGRTHIEAADVEQAARFVLPHRMRRQPLERVGPVAPGPHQGMAGKG